MFSLIVLTIIGILAIANSKHRESELAVIPHKFSEKLSGLWEVAHQGMRDNRFVRAEKALLTILNIDKRNAAAYNRLGILYAKQKEFKDAIDCFEIASSIEPSASSLHNLGLIYYETENYEKAETAFSQALKLDGEMPARHIAYAKVQEKVGNRLAMLQSLEKAVELEPTREALMLLYQAYIDAGKEEEAIKIERQLVQSDKIKSKVKRRVTRPRRVVV